MGIIKSVFITFSFLCCNGSCFLFLRTFSEFENGFGKVSEEHWLGLRYQHTMTAGKKCQFVALLDLDKSSVGNKDVCAKGYPADCNGQVRKILFW